MPVKSCHTNSKSTVKGEEGSRALQGVNLKFPVHIIPSTVFFSSLLKQRNKNDPKDKRKRNRSWYEELHQVTLPAREATVTENRNFVQWHIFKVRVSEIQNIENH